MKKHYKNIYQLIILLLLSPNAFAFKHDGHDPYAVTFLDRTRIKSPSYQEELRNQSSWQHFLQNHPGWAVDFDESSGLPHRAFGDPVVMNGYTDPANAAQAFINLHLKGFIKSNVILERTGITTSPKYINVNYKQTWNGMEVLFSRLTIRMTHDYKVVLFGLEIQNEIAVSSVPGINTAQAIAAATKDFTNVSVNVSAQPVLKLLALPVHRTYSHKLVYELTVGFKNEEGMPSSYYTLVDASNGTILYRSNKINHFSQGGGSVTVQGTVYPTHPYNSTQVLPLQYVNVLAGSSMYTDDAGFLNFPNGTTNVTVTLKGLYGQVYTGQNGTTFQSFTANVIAGSNTLSFDPVSDPSHLGAYYHTNVVHDYMKSMLPTFTDMDVPIDIRVERTDGNCNAFYDGGLNFYTQSNGCHPLSLVSDVVYHEYGHGINYQFYAANGAFFQNGAMGEGYSDVWALCITNNPVLGIGMDDTDPTVFVRNYDFANGAIRKVYPQNLVGEVHSDGEIICGAWWDVALNLGSVSAMADLYAETLYGLANGPDGSEGQVYMDVLIDALMADDTDGNLMNGTPNATAIANAFALHGITLLSSASLAHTNVMSSPSSQSITIDASLTNVSMTFAWALSGVKCAYALNNSTSWTTVPMTTANGTNYTVSIPGQSSGTVIKYYVYVEDINGAKSHVKPAGAEAAEPNIPYFIRVGYDLLLTDDFDNNVGNWAIGVPSDNATTGVWEYGTPVASNVNGVTVQPSTQVTPGGSICMFTGNATASSAAGTNDVDGGKTTLELQGIDLSQYDNPAIEYYRWYSNDQGSTPGTDYWRVDISNDAGVTYIPVENTRVADHSWRNFVFRVSDYVAPNANIWMRFIAEDANAGSLVEALVDEFSVYEQGVTSVKENAGMVNINVYPNPVSNTLSVKLNFIGTAKELIIENALGENVYSEELSAGVVSKTISTEKLPDGIYILKVTGGNNSSSRKFVVTH